LPAQDLRGFSEKVALVTGAGSGAGRAVALQLALQGAYVIAVHSPGAPAETVRAVEELRAIGTLAHVVEADVSTFAGARQAIAAVDSAYQRLDLLVNALGVGDTPDAGDTDVDGWDSVIRATLRSAFISTRFAAPLMQNRPAPAVVNIAAPGLDAANETAAVGLSGLTESLARELAPKIRVNCVIARAALNGGQATREPVAPNEVARAVIFLLSSDAKAITGQTLRVGAEW
jgi:3-oxoacyl-[acyl-carrier protein] reductase